MNQPLKSIIRAGGNPYWSDVDTWTTSQWGENIFANSSKIITIYGMDSYKNKNNDINLGDSIECHSIVSSSSISGCALMVKAGADPSISKGATTSQVF